MGKMITIPEWKLKDIENTLRMCNNALDSYKKDTCLNRCICTSWGFAQEMLKEQREEISIRDIAIFSSNDKEGADIIQFFVKNGAKNIWQHKGEYRQFYNVQFTKHINDYAIYSYHDVESVEKFGKKAFTLLELENYTIKNS